MGTWHTVGRADEVSESEPLSISVGGKEIGIYRVNGTLYGIEDVCPHAYALLTQGFVDGDNVECSLHGAIFNIPSGRCLKEPGGRDLATYRVREADGNLQIELD
jgi:3-phenylpropionate/trans-cinnamate dioxygenase ferredoxin subunit